MTERLEHAAVLDLAGSSLTGLDVLDVGCGDGAYVVVVGELGMWSPGELRDRLRLLGLEPVGQRGAAFYPPVGALARGAERLDRWVGRRVGLGAAFVAVAARKPRS